MLSAPRSLQRLALFPVIWLVIACTTPITPVSPTVYDFGPNTALPAPGKPAVAPVALAEVQTAWGESSTAMHYRLAYANAQALRTYTQSRWSMPPAQLVAQRVRAALSPQRPVVHLGEGASEWVLHLTLDDFGQTFDTPQTSQATVQWHASLRKGSQLVAQRDFAASAAAPTPDAAGGVQALARATQTAAEQLAAWVAEATR